MGSTNFGTQIQSVQYYAAADSVSWNRRNKDIEAVGLYKGGFLTKVSDISVSLSTFVVEISDASYQIKVETQSVVTLAVAVSTPLVVLRWSYVGSLTNRFMDVLAIAAGTNLSTDVIVGKCTFAGSTLTGFDYASRTIPMKFKNFLKVVPTETASMKVHVNGGWVITDSAKQMIAEQDTSTIVAPVSQPRIDYIYIDVNGIVKVQGGAENASPVAPNYSGRNVLAEILLYVGQTSIVASDITDVRGFVGTSGGAGGSIVTVAQTTHGFVVGNVLRRTSGSYVKAQADSAANAESVGIVCEVIDSGNFKLAGPGTKVTGLSGLTDGTVYFLDPYTAGATTATEPSAVGQVSKPEMIAVSTTEAIVLGMRGVLLSLGVVETGIVPQGLRVKNNVTNPTYRVDIACTAIRINGVLFSGVSKTVDITASGVNGLDTGTEAISTWYYAYLITKVDGTINALLSASPTSPTLPSGYAAARLVGAVYNTAAGHFMSFGQIGGRVMLDNNYGVVAAGVDSSYTAFSVGVYVPTQIAIAVHGLIVLQSTDGTAQSAQLFLRDNAFPSGAQVEAEAYVHSGVTSSVLTTAFEMPYSAGATNNIAYYVSSKTAGSIYVNGFTLPM